MEPSDVPVPPELDSLLEKELEKILADAPRVIPPKNNPLDLKSLDPVYLAKLVSKINWYLEGHRQAQKVGDHKMGGKIRRELRKLGWYVSKQGYGPLDITKLQQMKKGDSQ